VVAADGAPGVFQGGDQVAGGGPVDGGAAVMTSPPGGHRSQPPWGGGRCGRTSAGTPACVAAGQASVANAGVLSHPDGGEVVGLGTRGDALNLRLLRQRPRATVIVRSGGTGSR
jgi:hypothetical protein